MSKVPLRACAKCVYFNKSTKTTCARFASKTSGLELPVSKCRAQGRLCGEEGTHFRTTALPVSIAPASVAMLGLGANLTGLGTLAAGTFDLDVVPLSLAFGGMFIAIGGVAWRDAVARRAQKVGRLYVDN